MYIRPLLFCLIFLVVAFFVSACTDAPSTPAADEAAVPPVSGTTLWTVMVYLDADNDLESNGVDDLNEMEKGISDAIAAGNVGIATNLNVIVLMDRIGGYSAAAGDWTDTRLFRIKPDSTSSFASERLDDSATAKARHIAALGEKNMGDAATLGWFIDYCTANYPAQNYGLVFWNHGGGTRAKSTQGVAVTLVARDGSVVTVSSRGGASKAVCWDDTSGEDACLYLDQIQATLATRFNSGSKLGFIGFDACLMGMVEVAYEFRNLASYMAGSMNSEGAAGWDYAYLLSHLGAGDVTPETFAATIVDQYYNQYGTSGSTGETQSAINLSAVSLLKTRIDELAVALVAWVAPGGTINATYSGQLATIRDAACHYYESDEDSISYPFYDLYSLCSGLISSANSTAAVKTAAQAVNTQLAIAVVKAFGDSGVSTQPDYYGTGASVGRGLSIFFSRGNILYSGDSHYVYHWWYTAEDTQTWWEAGQCYGKIDFCNSDADGTVEGWREMLEFFYDNGGTATPSSN